MNVTYEHTIGSLWVAALWLVPNIVFEWLPEIYLEEKDKGIYKIYMFEFVLIGLKTDLEIDRVSLLVKEWLAVIAAPWETCSPWQCVIGAII